MICQFTLGDALAGKTSHAVELFRKIAAMVRRFGAVEIVPQKTRIALQVRKIFRGIRFLRDAIDCELALARRIEHPRFRQILAVSPRSYYHYPPGFVGPQNSTTKSASGSVKPIDRRSNCRRSQPKIALCSPHRYTFE